MVSAPTNALKPAEGESDIDQVAGRIQHLHKFKHVYDHIDFNHEQRLAIIKSIIESPTQLRHVTWSREGLDIEAGLMTMQPCSMIMTGKDSLATTTGHPM